MSKSNHSSAVTAFAAAIVGLLAIAVALTAAGAPSPEIKVSSYVPAADLAEALHAQATRLEQLLEKQDEFDLARMSRIAKEANIAAVVALALGMSDEEHPAKKSAAAALAAAQTLAKVEEYGAAKQALENLKKAADGELSPTTAVRQLRWEPVAPLGLLMKQVPIVHNNLKRAVQGDRLKSQAKASSAAAAAIAAIAMESATDLDAVKKGTDEAKWREFCAEMRDAAGNVDRAIHAGDSDRTEQAMKQLNDSCEHCHRTFRRR